MQIKKTECDTIEYAQYAHWLSCVPGIGARTSASLRAHFGSLQAVYKAKEEEFCGILPGKTAAALVQSRKRWDLEREYALLGQRGIRFYPIGHPAYPKRLLHLQDAPAALYCIGELPHEETPAAAVIGARNCSGYGKQMAQRTAMALAKAGVSVISGMARGIDAIAQQAAIEAGGKSYAVLGSGVLVCYPEQNRQIYETLKERGGILSEYSPYTQPLAGLFPARNRIISGLAEAVIVIEAKRKSGTCITVDMALEQGKEVYAVPGRVGDALSAGCNEMIWQGAGIVTEPESLPELLFGLPVPKKKTGAPEKTADACLSKRQRSILEAMGTTPVSVGALYEKMPQECYGAQFTPVQLRMELMDMLLKGCVQNVGGSYFQRVYA